MTTYLLRDIDRDLWTRVKVRAARDRLSIRDVLIQFLRAYAAGRVLTIAVAAVEESK